MSRPSPFVLPSVVSRLCVLGGLLLSLGWVGGASIPAEAAKPPVDAATLTMGEKAFAFCSTCHSLAAGAGDGAGPNLHGLFGSKAGKVSSTFSYSPALKAYGVTWTEETLDVYLANPSQAVRGTFMGARGPSDPVKRRALIAYLKVKTS